MFLLINGFQIHLSKQHEQGNQQDIVKLNYKCVYNNLNKWRFEQKS